MYSIELSQRSQKFLEKLDDHIRKRIEDRLINLGETSIPSNTKFICRDMGDKVFRYHIGDYRVLYKVKEREEIILIAKIDKRGRVYD